MTRKIFKTNYEELEDVYRELDYMYRRYPFNDIGIEILEQLKEDLIEMVRRDSAMEK